MTSFLQNDVSEKTLDEIIDKQEEETVQRFLQVGCGCALNCQSKFTTCASFFFVSESVSESEIRPWVRLFRAQICRLSYEIESTWNLQKKMCPVPPEILPDGFIAIFSQKFSDNLHGDDFAILQSWSRSSLTQSLPIQHFFSSSSTTQNTAMIKSSTDMYLTPCFFCLKKQC